ncbi:MAG: tail fiber domain-containing protein [Myxococcales bacterium]|nr:tail fiber domain-containing protein [Myxococcales bacterium]
MTMTYRLDTLTLLASLVAAPLLVGCPGGTGDLGDHGDHGDDSTSGSTTSPGSEGSSGSGPTVSGTESSGGSDSDGGTTADTGDQPCTEDECGPAPGAPNFLCQDGVTWGGPGPCERGPDGTCGWTFVECPVCCYAPEQPPCIEGASCCADGAWACNDDAGMPACEVGIECACCWEGDMPDCIEGATCCGGGVWACNGAGGVPTCDGEPGVVCDLPPPEECCDPADAPPCIEGSICCADGSWACNDPGGMPPCETGDVCGGGMCQGQGETCAGGETCCGGLTCCEGVPVPPGAEYCAADCPISDRERKENFEGVDTKAVLETLVQVPITTWNYTFEDPSIRHVGPMAQDFQAAFSVGATDEKIFQIDADGVALASIQALHTEVEQLREQNARLEQALAELERRLDGAPLR